MQAAPIERTGSSSTLMAGSVFTFCLAPVGGIAAHAYGNVSSSIGSLFLRSRRVALGGRSAALFIDGGFLAGVGLCRIFRGATLCRTKTGVGVYENGCTARRFVRVRVLRISLRSIISINSFRYFLQDKSNFGTSSSSSVDRPSAAGLLSAPRLDAQPLDGFVGACRCCCFCFGIFGELPGSLALGLLHLSISLPAARLAGIFVRRLFRLSVSVYSAIFASILLVFSCTKKMYAQYGWCAAIGYTQTCAIIAA